MLVSLNIKSYAARRYDRKVSQDVADQHQADHKVGRYNKCLIDPKAASFLALSKARQAAYDWHYEQTLPWAQDGARVLPSTNYFEYAEVAQQHKRRFEQAATDFIADFPGLQAAAKLALNGLYREADYPSIERLKAKFAFEVTFLPVPDAQDWRVDLGVEQEQAIREQITTQVERAANEAMRDIWQRLYDAVQHMVERLSQPDAVFRDSLIGNVRELCALLPRLNLTQDPALNAMIDEVRAKLSGNEPQRLRDDKDKRSQVAEQARALAARMASYMGA